MRSTQFAAQLRPVIVEPGTALNSIERSLTDDQSIAAASARVILQTRVLIGELYDGVSLDLRDNGFEAAADHLVRHKEEIMAIADVNDTLTQGLTLQANAFNRARDRRRDLGTNLLSAGDQHLLRQIPYSSTHLYRPAPPGDVSQRDNYAALKRLNDKLAPPPKPTAATSTQPQQQQQQSSSSFSNRGGWGGKGKAKGGGGRDSFRGKDGKDDRGKGGGGGGKYKGGGGGNRFNRHK
jgi:hypothetical protein